jgi:hypothetical protein
MIAITLMSFSCCKDDDPVVDEGLITLDNLNGTWNFVSFNFEGTEYNCSSMFMPENIENMFSSLTFDIDAMTVLMDWVCTAGGSVIFDFIKDVDTIKFNTFGYVNDDIKYTFTVISYDNNQLMLRLDTVPSLYPYIGGIITLTK